jgi:uroporphyrinogen-III decarboxylase
MRTPDIERLLAAFRREPTEEVPNFEIVIDPRSLSHLLGTPVRDNLWSIAPPQRVEAVQAVGQDAIPCPLHAGIPEASLQSEADVEALAFPNPNVARARVQACLDTVAGTGVGVCACITGPLTSAYMAWGPVAIESFMFLLYDDEDLAARLMDRFVEHYEAVLDAVADLPLHFYYIGDDVGGSAGPMIGPRHLEALWAPRARRLVDRAHEADKPVLFHCCGDQSSVLPFAIEWGVEAIHPLQPPVNDIYGVHQQYGDRLCLVGNVDAGGVLTFGSPAEVRKDTREHLERLSGGGGYVCGSSHSIIDSIPPENYLAMVEAIHEFKRAAKPEVGRDPAPRQSPERTL